MKTQRSECRLTIISYSDKVNIYRRSILILSPKLSTYPILPSFRENLLRGNWRSLIILLPCQSDTPSLATSFPQVSVLVFSSIYEDTCREEATLVSSFFPYIILWRVTGTSEISESTYCLWKWPPTLIPRVMETTPMSYFADLLCTWPALLKVWAMDQQQQHDLETR